jgi:hypothetical protein
MKKYLIFSLLLGLGLSFWWPGFLESYLLEFKVNEIVFLTLTVKKNLIDFILSVVTGAVISIIDSDRYSKSVVIVLLVMTILFGTSIMNKVTSIDIVHGSMFPFYFITCLLGIVMGIVGLMTDEYLKPSIDGDDYSILQLGFYGLSFAVGTIITFAVSGILLAVIYSLIVILLSMTFQGICYSIGWLLGWCVRFLLSNSKKALSWTFD